MIKKMKPRTVRYTAAINSISPTVLGAIAVVLLNAPWWVCVLSTVAIYIVNYLLSLYFIQDYVIYRIKPLYQIMFSREIPTFRLSAELRKIVQDDIINDIQKNLDHLIEISDNEMERLKQKDTEMTNFLIAVAHEIRTPVFNVQAYAETLLENWEEDPEMIPQFAERIASNANRLGVMVEDIDKLSSYESGGEIVYKDYFDLRGLINEVIDTDMVHLRKKNLSVEIKADSFNVKKNIPVYAERFRMFQVLENLLLNAINYSYEKGKITIGLIDMFDKVLVEFTDRGQGIPPKDLVRIFEKFYRVDQSRSRQTGGSGMGLAMVKRVIDNHGETITARSELGAGTTVSFSIAKKPAKKSDK